MVWNVNLQPTFTLYLSIYFADGRGYFQSLLLTLALYLAVLNLFQNQKRNFQTLDICVWYHGVIVVVGLDFFGCWHSRNETPLRENVSTEIV